MVREDFGECTNLEAIDRLLEVSGLDILDIGCGAGALARALAERGARVLAVEPDPVQAAKNRQAPPAPGVTFVEAGAEALPVGDRSVDGAIFCFSLHHVPAAAMETALAEALRVLRPESGFLFVIEPVMTGSYAELMRPFHDETEARRLARDAVAHFAGPRFAEARGIHYRQWLTHTEYETFLAEKLGTTYNDHRREMVDIPEVRAIFESGRIGDGYRFEQIIQANLFRGVVPIR